MTKKEKYDNMFMHIANISANMSYAKRKKVGSVLTKDNRVLINSWNGTISGTDNECEYYSDNEYTEIQELLLPKNSDEKYAKDLCTQQDWKYEKCEKYSDESNILKYREKKLITKPEVIHAEANALMYAAKNGICTKDCTLYVTLSPCIECAKLIIQSGIKKVIYKEKYRNLDGVNFLKQHIDVEQMK